MVLVIWLNWFEQDKLRRLRADKFSWKSGLGWGSLAHPQVFLSLPRRPVWACSQGRDLGELTQLCKRLLEIPTLFWTVYWAFVKAPLAKAGHVANPRGRRGERRGPHSYKVKNMDPGRPFIRTISAINLNRQCFVRHLLGRSREILHSFKFFHDHFSFCFAIIISEAGRQHEKNQALNQWDPHLNPDSTTSGCKTLCKFPLHLHFLIAMAGLLSPQEEHVNMSSLL